MATTTNYGWTTPDDTALVSQGAAAIRTLGSSVDTTTKNLNPQTTTGAIAYRSSTANVNTSLPLGTAGQVLTVNSGATAPEWKAAAAGALVYITGATFTAAATVSMASGVFTSTYENYLVILNITASSVDQNISIRINNAGSPRTAANYYGGKVWRTTSATSTGTTSHNFAAVRTSYPSVAHSIYVTSPVTSTVKTNWFSTGIGYPDGGGTGTDISTSACNYDVAEANDGLTFFVGGTITGFYKVYGIANSQDYDD